MEPLDVAKSAKVARSRHYRRLCQPDDFSHPNQQKQGIHRNSWNATHTRYSKKCINISNLSNDAIQAGLREAEKKTAIVCVCVFHATLCMYRSFLLYFTKLNCPNWEMRWGCFYQTKNSARDSTPENSIASYIIWTFLDVARHVWDGDFKGDKVTIQDPVFINT